MSWRSSATPLTLKLNPSSGLAALIVIAHTGGLICLWLAPAPSAAQWAGSVLVIVSTIHSLRRYAFLRDPLSVVCLEWHVDGWLLTDRRNIQHPVELSPDSMRFRWLVVLIFRTEGKRRFQVPILRDMLDPDDYRRLQVRLTVNAC